MKKTLSSILLGLTLATGAVTAQTNFRSIDFNEALKQSQAENKLVFIDFYTDWCGPCRKYFHRNKWAITSMLNLSASS